jgi:hypothetical protein
VRDLNLLVFVKEHAVSDVNLCVCVKRAIARRGVGVRPETTGDSRAPRPMEVLVRRPVHDDAVALVGEEVIRCVGGVPVDVGDGGLRLEIKERG